ncbi:hypothetical protein CHARACLAT_007928 [Characodon lateralis]|uniref:Uncharacterized protein n=1 Tax=Characodon lateralis TaxID=208331 RepID=A0ABU7EH96_9TELE|nr:hypothetical protein [Characodon lateralis]
MRKPRLHILKEGEVIIWERKSKEEKEINCSNDRAHWILSTLGPVCQVDMFQTVPDTSSYVKSCREMLVSMWHASEYEI